MAMNELLTAPSESLTSPDGDVAEVLLDDCAEVADFSAFHARELSGLVWFVMSRGTDSHRAADVAQLARRRWSRPSRLGGQRRGTPRRGPRSAHERVRAGAERSQPHRLAFSATLRTRIAR